MLPTYCDPAPNSSTFTLINFEYCIDIQGSFSPVSIFSFNMTGINHTPWEPSEHHELTLHLILL